MMVDWMASLSAPLIQNMFAATAIACVLCGVIGVFVVVRRMVSVTGGIAHTTFGGVGFAYYVQSVLLVSWFSTMLGALMFAVISAVIMAIPSISEKVRQDSMIGTLWAVGMASGVIFMSLMDRSVITPRSYESILFGDVLLVGQSDILIMLAVSFLILITISLRYRDLQILSFDEDHARLSGIHTDSLNLMLYIMVAVTCVMVSNIIGIVMIIALITMPAAIASILAHDMKDVILISVAISVSLSLFGLILSIAFDLPPGATVSIVIGLVFIIALLSRSPSAMKIRG